MTNGEKVISIGKWLVTEEGIKSMGRYFLAVALVVWAYNLGYNDAIKTVQYVQDVCGPGAIVLNGNEAQIMVMRPTDGFITGSSPLTNPLIHINDLNEDNSDGVP